MITSFLPHAPRARLVLLEEGETLEAKAAKLRDEGAIIANAAVIRRWMEGSPEDLPRGPIVIADPTAEPIVRGTDYQLVYVPAHAINERGGFVYDGLIDLRVPMWPAKAGGQLAILVLFPDSPAN